MYCNKETGELLAMNEAYETIAFLPENHPIVGYQPPVFRCPEELKEWSLNNGYKASHSVRFNRPQIENMLLGNKENVSRFITMCDKIERMNVLFIRWNILANLWQVSIKTVRRTLDTFTKLGVCYHSTDNVEAKNTVRVITHPHLFCIGYNSYRYDDYCANHPVLSSLQEPPVGLPVVASASVSAESGMSDYVDYEEHSAAYKEALMRQAKCRSDVVKHCSDIEFSMLLNGELSMADLLDRYYPNKGVAKC